MASGTHKARPDWFKPVRFYARDLPYLIKKASVAPMLTKCYTVDKAIEARFPSHSCLDEMGKSTLARLLGQRVFSGGFGQAPESTAMQRRDSPRATSRWTKRAPRPTPGTRRQRAAALRVCSQW